MSDEAVYIKLLKTGNNIGTFKVTADNYTTPTVSLISPNDTIPGYYVSKTSFVVGSTQLDDTTNPDNDARMLFDKTNGAFRAGTATGTQWDSVNRGTNSTALGNNNKASGNNSFAVGDSNTASGINAIAIGNNNLVYNSTTGTTPVAIGQDNTININSQWGIAIGKNNTTSTGNSPILIGNTNSSGSGHNSVAIGQSNTASSVNSVAIGSQNTASTAANATAIGQYCTATGANSFAIGYGTSGTNNIAAGTGSVAIGNTNNATGNGSFAIGNVCTAGAAASIAIGNYATTIHDTHMFSLFWNGHCTYGGSPIPHTMSGIAGSAEFVCSARGSFRVLFGSNDDSTPTTVAEVGSALSSETGYSWSSSSSIDLKENLVEHTYSDTLDKIMEMPIYTYNFKTVAPGIKSIGPVAQDFNRLFPSDKDQLSIVERDMCGVALAGVKGVKLGLDSLSTTTTNTSSAQQSQINTLIESLATANTQITTLSVSLTSAIVRITALESEAVTLKSKVDKLEKDKK